jgi:putative flippase GtrA
VQGTHRWGIFNVVGFGGFVLQMTTLSVLTRAAGWHYGIATAVGLELAILHNFFGHSRWTWADRPASGRQLLARLGRYQVAKSLSLAANLGITAWLVASLQMPVEIASTAAVVCLSFVNFFITDLFVFRTPVGGAVGFMKRREDTGPDALGSP